MGDVHADFDSSFSKDSSLKIFCSVKISEERKWDCGRKSVLHIALAISSSIKNKQMETIWIKYTDTK